MSDINKQDLSKLKASLAALHNKTRSLLEEIDKTEKGLTGNGVEADVAQTAAMHVHSDSIESHLREVKLMMADWTQGQIHKSFRGLGQSVKNSLAEKMAERSAKKMLIEQAKNLAKGAVQTVQDIANVMTPSKEDPELKS